MDTPGFTGHAVDVWLLRNDLIRVSQPQTLPNGELLTTEHLEALIEAFVVSERRERYLFLARTPKRRTELTNRLAHWRDFDTRRAATLPPEAQASPTAVAHFLQAHGAPRECYVLSESHEIDGRLMPLAEALAALVGRGMGTCSRASPGGSPTTRAKRVTGTCSPWRLANVSWNCQAIHGLRGLRPRSIWFACSSTLCVRPRTRKVIR